MAFARTLTPGHSAAQQRELDTLLDRLAQASDEPEARALADHVWQIWARPDDAELAARMAAILTASGFAGPAGQMPLIEKLIADYPDYAEGWNLRATAHFLRGDHDAALADIEQVLSREPRHFGALSGRALIYHSQGRYADALEAMKAALAIHPFLPERGLFPELGQPPIRS
ncbi:MAG: hypothetical protein ABS75_28580 [Pelagibacterium sp. SCN 63-23]|nr:MAG: hypothetical protein ABS75_28580 [Pelagibacterium sp. SCN 63-23]